MNNIEQQRNNKMKSVYDALIQTKTIELVKKIEQLAAKKNCTASQLALAWVLAQGDHIFPIPGTKRIKYLEENIGALNIHLSIKELEEIDPSDLPAVLEGLAQLKRGERATPEQVEVAFRSFA